MKKAAFLTLLIVAVSGLAFAASQITVTDTTPTGVVVTIAGPQGVNGAGIPTGGVPGQLLAKKGYGNYSGQWINPPAGTGDMTAAMYDPTGKNADAFDYNNLNNKPSIPAPLANATTLGKITESAGQPLWNGATWPGGNGAVSSVNGQTGAVTAATTAQGAKADTAVQPPTLSSTLMGWANGAWTGIRAAFDSVYHGMTVTWSEITGKPSLPQTITCSGTDKVSSYNAVTGAYTCTADQTSAGGTGITSLNGATVGSQTFANGTNISVSTNTGTGVHTIGITGTIGDGNIASAATWSAKPSLTNTAPNMDGVASAGSGSSAARVDHVHPTDTSRAPVDTPTFTGTVTAPAYVSNAADGGHYVECSNSGAMTTTGWSTTEEGRWCYDKTLHKFRYWSGSAIADLASTSTGGGTWGSITGTLASQTDLNTALSAKQAALGFTPLNPSSNLAELSNKGTALTNLGAAAAVGNQDIEITDATKGLLLRSAGGNRYRLLVADNGTLSTALVNATVFAPSAPTGLSASGGNLQTTVNWSSSVVDASHSAATSYDVLWGTTSGGESNTLTGVTSPYTHTGLTAATTYFYKVRANNTAGSATSTTEASATTNSTTYAPNAPVSVVATPGNTQNTIAWAAGVVDGTHSAATSYNLRWGTTSGGETNTITGVTSPYVHTPLTNGQPYYYVVRAINTGGQADSSEATATPDISYIAHAEFNSGTIDSGFSFLTSGTGTGVSNSPTGYATLTSASGGSAILRYDSALPANKVWTVTVKGKVTGGNDNVKLIGIYSGSAPPTATGGGTASDILQVMLGVNNQYLVQYTDTTQFLPRWNGSTWSTSNAWTAGVTSGTEYQAIIHSDATNVTFTIKSADGSSTITTASVPWSLIYQPGANLYFYAGDGQSDAYYGTGAYDYVRIQ